MNFTGNLGRDAERRNVNGNSVINMVVAVKSGYGDNEQTLWMDCAIWGKRAEGQLIDYLKKGQRVSVSGELGSREYDKDGQTRTALTIRVGHIGLEGKAEPQQQSGGHQAQQAPQRQQPHNRPSESNHQGQAYQHQGQQSQSGQQPAGMDDFDDDIPF
jgi:single-strand DNA-binding protein